MNDIVTTVRVPRRVMTLIAANIIVWIGVYAVIIGMTSGLGAGLGFFIIAAALLIPVLFLYYLLWRYFWWIWAITATCGTLLFLGLLLMYPFAASRYNSLLAQSGRSINVSNDIIIVLLIVTLLPLLLWVFRGGNNSRPTTQPSDSPFDFSPRNNRQQPQQPRMVRRNDELSPIQFQNEVARLLIEKNPELDIAVQENQMDIDVYLDGKPIGIVRCKLGRSDAPIAPMFVQEVHRMKERLGLPIAYIATSAQFNDDARHLADELDIRLLDGDKIKQYQHKSARN
jgi:hypothetical protein